MKSSTKCVISRPDPVHVAPYSLVEKNIKAISIFWLPIIVGFFIALLSPDNILDLHPYVRFVTEGLKSIFYPIAGYVGKSKFPQVSECYFSFMFIVFPYYFFVVFHAAKKNDGLINWNPTSWMERIKVFIVGVMLTSSLAYFALFINPGYDFNILPVNSSRLALGMSGYALSSPAAAYLLAIACCLLKKIFFYKSNNI